MQADIIVPVYNEAEILPRFYERITSLGLDLNLIFIDNASNDDSVAIIDSFDNVQLIRHSTNEGYGSSLIDGMRTCTNDNIIIIDADCEYPPEAIANILTALEGNDIVYTSRLLNGNTAKMPFLKYTGNRIISGLFNTLFGQNTTDLYTGCKGFKRHCLEGIDFKRMGFEHVLEFACLLSRQGYKIVDVPVVFEPRHTGSSKMKHLSETSKFLSLLIYYGLTLPNRPR